jgi:hypothetical protein
VNPGNTDQTDTKMPRCLSSRHFRFMVTRETNYDDPTSLKAAALADACAADQPCIRSAVRVVPDGIRLSIKPPAVAHDARTSHCTRPAPVVVSSVISITLVLWRQVGGYCCICISEFCCFRLSRESKPQRQQCEHDSKYFSHASFPLLQKTWSGTLTFLERARPY